ncbi:S8 family peptidase [Noviherbaspirillum agri]
MQASIRRAVLAVLCLSGMTACGGGGGGGDYPAPTSGDPLFAQQWHLKNTGQAPASGSAATAGADINVEPVWASCGAGGTCKGEGVTIAVVDIGLEIDHPDLQPNISTALAHRIYPSSGPTTGNPTPPASGINDFSHGTQVGGIIASRDDNGTGGRGVAPRASLVGYSMLLNRTDSNEADAMTYQAASIAVSNNSWGPPDGSGRIDESSSLWREAIDYGLANGRGGRGTIYVWPAGNGYAGSGELSNEDGYANYRGVIAVGAVNAQGTRAPYSEPGANVWVTAPGGEDCETGLAITTADLTGSRGANDGSAASELRDADYTQCAVGTSFSTAIVSGAAALMVQANPALTWRDVRTILAQTARRNDASDVGWAVNGAGRPVHHTYGFGMVDAAAAVTAARGWTNLPAQRSYESPVQTVNTPIPENPGAPVNGNITVAGSGISRIEWVDVTFTAADHAYAGDLQVVLISPSGTQSILAAPHACRDDSCNPYDGWRFGVARLLDEPADGVWQLIVRDQQDGDTGTFQSWQIRVYGH